jgi:hypothetical protein
MKTMISLMEFALNAMALGACPTKRWTSRDEELEEASEQPRRSLPKNLIRPLSVQDR